MQYTNHYDSPLGGILLACDETGLTGLWFDEQKYFAAGLIPEHAEKPHPHFEQAKRWLDIYFSGRKPKSMPRLSPVGSPFRLAVWRILLDIPWGQVVTYGDIAHRLEAERGGRVSAQAVGGAVGHNPLSLMIPCHRVIGAGGNLIGYAGGLPRKRYLLELEGVDVSGLRPPQVACHGTGAQQYP